MTAFASMNFPCPRCGAQFALTPDVALRKIECPCGHLFTAPAIPLVSPDPDPYDVDLAPGERAAPSKPASSHADLYPRRKIRAVLADDSEIEFSFARDRLVPVALLLAGLALRIAEIPYDRSISRGSLAAALAIILFQIILAVVLMLAGVLLSAKILAANFGPAATAVLKLAGMAVFAWAAGALVVISLQYNIRAYLIAIQIIIIIYSVLFWLLFSLDLQEAILTVAICTFLQNAATLVIFSGG